MPPRSTQTRLLFVACVISLVPVLADCEEFFRTRSRVDNVDYRVMEDRNAVTSTEKAEEILKRYGYLRCGGSRRRPAGRRQEGGGGRRCSGEEVRLAVRRYQDTYNTPATGRLDPATLKVMSESRCGNPDDEHRPFRPMIRPRKRHWRKSHPSQTSGRRKRDASRAAPTAGPPVHPHEPPPETVRPHAEPVPMHRFVLRDRSGRSAAAEGRWPPGATGRRRFLEQHVRDLEDGQERPDAARGRRSRRSPLPAAGLEGQAFSNEVVTWRLIGSAYSNQLTANTQRAALSLAFRMWGEVIPLVFQEDVRSPVDDVDVLVAFGRGEHLNCPNQFDGFGGQLSHAVKMSAANAEIHVDDDEQLTVGSERGTNLVKVAVHEVGHALGLSHTSRNDSVMYAIYSRVVPNDHFELGWRDRKLVQDIYGTCRVRFDTVFDWVRRRPDGQLIYNTYLFRHNRYWMYENRHNRTRYGDPLRVAPEWKGLPDGVQAYAHVWTYAQDAAYFFKGHHFWLYDSAADRVVAGYPKNISAEFRAAPGSGHPDIPGNLDSVFFDKRDGNLYFFKGSLVYAYEAARGREGCCLPGYPKAVRQEFPGEAALPAHLDAVYYSYTDRSMYFLKGASFWQNVAFNPLDRRRTNRVQGPWPVASKWFDICDVEV